MVNAGILLRVVDGERKPFDGDMLVTLFDGLQRTVHQASHRHPALQFTIPFTNTQIDRYRVVVSAKNRLEAGQYDITLRAGAMSAVDVMLLPRRSILRFQPLSALEGVHARLGPLVRAFLHDAYGSESDDAYKKLQDENPGGLATLLNIASGFAGFAVHPFDFVTKLDRLDSDRFFGNAKSEMVRWLEDSPRTFHTVPHALHVGSFISYKEIRYLEGNVQFTFSKTDDASVVEVDSDIDLFRDEASHFLLEVVPTDYLHVSGKTDPRQAYALRWMSVQRLKPSTGFDFQPPYGIVMG